MSIMCYDANNNLVETLYQWDSDVRLTITGIPTSPVPKFHFSNRVVNEALSVTPTISGNTISVDVPNTLLTMCETIVIYAYVSSSAGSRTKEEARIKVIPRKRPSNYTYSNNAAGDSSSVIAQGEDGGYYTPSVSSSGLLSWTPSKSGMPAVQSTNIKGSTPQKGVDYWTESDKAEMVQSVLAAIPNGDEVSY